MQKVFFVDGVDSGVDLGRGIPLAEQKVQEALAKAREVTEAEGRILLILDGLDFLGAATGCEVIELLHMLGELQSVGFSLDHERRNPLTSCPPSTGSRLNNSHCCSGCGTYPIAHHSP